MKQQRESWMRYSGAWHATPEERSAIFREHVSEECVYRDPITTAEGWDALATYMLEFQSQFPGARFEIRDFKSHNNCSIAHWNMVASDGSVLSDGVSYGEYNDAGKVTRMTGFFDVPPQA